MQGIDVVVGKTAAVDESRQAPRDAPADPGDLVVFGRWQSPEAQSPRIGRVVDAVEDQQVEVLVEVRGKLDEAATILGRVLAGRERTLGPDHPATGFTLAALGELEVARGRPAAAREQFDRAARIFETHLREDHPAYAELRREMADLDASAAR